LLAGEKSTNTVDGWKRVHNIERIEGFGVWNGASASYAVRNNARKCDKNDFLMLSQMRLRFCVIIHVLSFGLERVPLY
jgi:hypothetical protein